MANRVEKNLANGCYKCTKFLKILFAT